MKNAHPRLDENDFLVIYHYSDANYQYVNGALWKNESLDDYLTSFKDLLNQALDKLPNRRGESYRGTRIPRSIIAKYENALANDEKVTEAAFLSTSLNEEIAKQYSRIGGKQEDVSVLFIIEGRNGKDIDAISKFGRTFNGTEGEILFKSGSQFKVTRIEGDQGLMEIWLQEM